MSHTQHHECFQVESRSWEKVKLPDWLQMLHFKDTGWHWWWSILGHLQPTPMVWGLPPIFRRSSVMSLHVHQKSSLGLMVFTLTKEPFFYLGCKKNRSTFLYCLWKQTGVLCHPKVAVEKTLGLPPGVHRFVRPRLPGVDADDLRSLRPIQSVEYPLMSLRDWGLTSIIILSSQSNPFIRCIDRELRFEARWFMIRIGQETFRKGTPIFDNDL